MPHDSDPPRAAPAAPLERCEWQDVRDAGCYLHLASGLIARVYAEDVAPGTTGGMQSGPIIVQHLLDMELHRSNGEVIPFQMKKKRYFTMAAASHPPLAIYSILVSQGGFGALTAQTVSQLSELRAVMSEARKEVVNVLETPVAERVVYSFGAAEELLDRAMAQGRLSQEEFASYALRVRPVIEANLELGAMEQLVQYKEQLDRWRAEFLSEDWKRLRVVVIGFHQARELYALKLFFQWLLHEPDYEHRVVFAEFQDSVSGANAKEADARALELLTKVDLDQPLGELVLGDSSAMGRDVMGPAAARILKEWGTPAWP